MNHRRHSLLFVFLFLVAVLNTREVRTQVVKTRLNQAPIANAGPDQTAEPGSAVILNGGASTDVDGDALRFAWIMLSRPEGSLATLENSSDVRPSFKVDVAGDYVVALVVNDGVTDSVADTVTISTSNSAPVADAGPDQTAAVGAAVLLNGSKSTDVDGNSLTYSWSVLSRPDDSSAGLSDSTAVLPTFVPDRPGTYVVQLIVHDGNTASVPDTMIVTTRNSPPVANPGSDQSAALGALVLLDGSTSSDADGDLPTYSWAITSRPAGSAAMIAGPLTPRPSFVADRAGTYVVQLIASDGTTKSAPATVTISTRNSKPLADAGPDQLSVEAGQQVTLSGDLSRDPDGDTLTYSWSVLARPEGSQALLDGAHDSRPQFTPDVAGDYVLQLIVNDGNMSSTPATVVYRADVVIESVVVTASDPSASETGPDPGAFTFSRSSETNLTSTLVLKYTVGGTATNGVDYTPALSGTVVIPEGQRSVTVTITPVQDRITEGPETVTVTIGNLIAKEGSPRQALQQ